MCFLHLLKRLPKKCGADKPNIGTPCNGCMSVKPLFCNGSLQFLPL